MQADRVAPGAVPWCGSAVLVARWAEQVQGRCGENLATQSARMCTCTAASSALGHLQAGRDPGQTAAEARQLVGNCLIRLRSCMHVVMHEGMTA